MNETIQFPRTPYFENLKKDLDEKYKLIEYLHIENSNDLPRIPMAVFRRFVNMLEFQEKGLKMLEGKYDAKNGKFIDKADFGAMCRFVPLILNRLPAITRIPDSVANSHERNKMAFEKYEQHRALSEQLHKAFEEPEQEESQGYRQKVFDEKLADKYMHVIESGKSITLEEFWRLELPKEKTSFFDKFLK